MAPPFWTALWALTLGSAAFVPQQPLAPTARLDTWLASETAVARQGILNNIGSGACAASAKAGVLIASPSTSNPDCKKLASYGNDDNKTSQTITPGLETRLWCSKHW